MEDAFSALVVIGVIFFRVILPVLRWFQKQQAEAAEKRPSTAPGGSAPVSDPMRALREAIEALAGGRRPARSSWSRRSVGSMA